MLKHKALGKAVVWSPEDVRCEVASSSIMFNFGVIKIQLFKQLLWRTHGHTDMIP